jgi:hypothetical protein
MFKQSFLDMPLIAVRTDSTTYCCDVNSHRAALTLVHLRARVRSGSAELKHRLVAVMARACCVVSVYC